MKFNKDHKVDIATLDRAQAKAFVDFLTEELGRHRVALFGAEMRGSEFGDRPNDYARAMAEFWASATQRHEEDIKEIEKLIKRVKDGN